jgi:hypothetical protein
MIDNLFSCFIFLHDVRLVLIDQVPKGFKLREKNFFGEFYTRNWLYVIISIPISFAFFLISFSFSSDNFFVSTIRFNVETCSIILSKVKTFSALSTKTVFNEATKQKNDSHNQKIYFILWFIIWTIAGSPSVS